MSMDSKSILKKEQALIAEGWEIEGVGKDRRVHAYGRKYRIKDPLAIHLHTYRTNQDHGTRFRAMKRSFEILWPDEVQTFHYWMERAFYEHCNWDTEYFVMAGGAACSKTYSAGYIGTIFWLSNPYENAVIDASTTLASLRSRIHGYIKRGIITATITPPHKIIGSPNPQIHPLPQDDIHGIFGVAAKSGNDEKAISDLIGRHPEYSLLVILDEGTDMPLALVDAFPNWRQGLKGRLQVIIIGNSKDKSDLHGALATPKNGWDSVSPEMSRWETANPGGVCLYFNPYDSPAIHETDPIKKRLLSQVLMNEEKLIAAEQSDGVDSVAFWRFTMGFWKGDDRKAVIATESFLAEYDCQHLAEFAGRGQIRVAAGLDPAFSTGGDKCILRLAALGQIINGQIVLDFRGESFIFEIPIRAGTGKSAEIQIADETIRILNHYQVPLNVLCIDASGQGKGLADIIQLRSGTGISPTKIYNTNVGGRMKKDDMGIFITSSHAQWQKGREFITHQQIYGLDSRAKFQLHSRLVIIKNGKETLESKIDYKRRMSIISSVMGGSPDHCDAAMLAIQSAMIHFGFNLGQKAEVTTYDNDLQRQLAIAIESQRATGEVVKQGYSPRSNYMGNLNSLINKRAF